MTFRVEHSHIGRFYPCTQVAREFGDDIRSTASKVCVFTAQSLTRYYLCVMPPSGTLTNPSLAKRSEAYHGAFLGFDPKLVLRLTVQDDTLDYPEFMCTCLYHGEFRKGKEVLPRGFTVP